MVSSRAIFIGKIAEMKRRQNKLPPITDQLLLKPAHKLSAQIKDGSLTSVKLCELYVDRIKQIQPLINAVTQDRFNEALEEARRIDELLAAFKSGKPEAEFSADELETLHSPLMGVPVSIKESIMVKGMKNTCGLWDRRDATATIDAVVVKNARRWGLVPFCMTNVPEGTLFWADCQNKIYGRTANPYDITRITGASSGGEGSLIGGAGSVIGIGSDIGGSLRIPAHYCGIYSHKPSPFLVSAEGNYPDMKEHRLRMFSLGPMCRYASDLRPFFKCLMSDKDNAKQDTYFIYQPEDIATRRKNILQALDEPVDFSKLKLFYFNFEESQLKGKAAIVVNKEFLEAQQEILDHFRSKYNCQVEHFNLDKFFKKSLITWQCMLQGAGTVDREENYVPEELKDIMGIDSMISEVLKMPFGLSRHTKESILIMLLDSTIPKDREKAFALCERFEKLGAELKEEFEQKLGDNGVLIMPALPTTAYKFNIALLKTPDLRFPSLFNTLQVPVTHSTMRLDKKNKLPFGFSVAAKQYNDVATIGVAEEIELAFGGWTQPNTISTDTSAALIANSSTEKLAKEVTNSNGTNSNHEAVAVPTA